MRFSPRAIGPWLTIVTLTAAGAAAAAGYAATAPKHYRATAQLLVTPVPANDPTFLGLDLLRSDTKQAAAASAAALVRSPQVADAVRAQLGLDRSRDSLLSSVDAHVVDDSDVVAITVDDTSATSAAQLANAFSDALVSQRTASFQSQLATTIRRDEQLLKSETGAGADELRRRLAVLRGLQGQPDPTLRSAGQASAPESASSTSLWELVLIGAGIGFAAGVVIAAIGLLARRIREPKPVPAYGQVPERVVSQLEQRLQEKVDALVDERERLSGRESALATREREVSEKVDELRTVVADTPAVLETADLERREAELAARVNALTRREVSLAKRAAAITARAEELERPAAESPAPDAGAAAAAAAALVARGRALDARAQELERRAAELETREREISALASIPIEPQAPAPAPAQPRVQPVAPSRGRWNLNALEKLVEQRAGEFPDRVEEWTAYLYFLREHAEVDGSVPASFDVLIEDQFAEIVDA